MTRPASEAGQWGSWASSSSWREYGSGYPPGAAHSHLGSGDDAAITVPEGATATSVDALVDGVHFRRGDAGPAQIGHKALATALSDLAAMGAEAG